MTENTSRRPAVLARAKALPPWTLIAAGALVGGLAGGSYGLLKPPVYTATAYVVAVPAEKSDPSSALGFAQAYGRVATQLAVLGDAQVWAGVPVNTLRTSVRTATSPDAPMVSITATSGRADLAADMANAVSRALTQHAKGTEKTTNVELQSFARAMKPTEPSSQSPAVTGLVGASAGGLLGGLVLLVRPKRGRGAGADGVFGAAGAAGAAEVDEAAGTGGESRAVGAAGAAGAGGAGRAAGGGKAAGAGRAGRGSGSAGVTGTANTSAATASSAAPDDAKTAAPVPGPALAADTRGAR